MTPLTIFGAAASPFVRTVLLACEAKGVNYTLENVNFRSSEYRSLHPFNRIPAMRHADVTLYETLAITTYIDEMFEGPALQPKSTLGRAKMLQSISSYSDYVIGTIGHVIIRERIAREVIKGEPPDEAKINKAIPDVERIVSCLNEAAARTGPLAGEALTLADLFLGPIISHFAVTPEGHKCMKTAPSLAKWLEWMRQNVKNYDKVNFELSPKTAKALALNT